MRAQLTDAATATTIASPAQVFPHRTHAQQRALRRFATSITILTLLGHAFLGFEQSLVQPIVALLTAYTMQLFLEWMVSVCERRRPLYLGGWRRLVDFLLPTHIAALAIAMLLHYNDRIWIVAFATAVAIGSKSIFRVRVAGRSVIFLNPSNFGITVTLCLFPSVGITMPWQWTAGISGVADWLFPIFVFVLGTLLHLKHGQRLWLIFSFLFAFVLQAVIRSVASDINLITALAPATGVPAAIFTFYMAPDPATTPERKWGQIAFGAAIALVYMILMLNHTVFALFFALTIVCFSRGVALSVIGTSSLLLSKLSSRRRKVLG